MEYPAKINSKRYVPFPAVPDQLHLIFAGIICRYSQVGVPVNWMIRVSSKLFGQSPNSFCTVFIMSISIIGIFFYI